MTPDPNSATVTPQGDSALAAPAQVTAPAQVESTAATTFADQIRAATAARTAPEPQAPGTVEAPIAAEQKPPDSDWQSKLAEAEKRVRDTQAWGHQKAQEAAKYARDLQSVLSHPTVSKALESLANSEAKAAAGQTQTPQQELADAELKQAFAEYQAAPSDEVAFAKLVQLSEQRGAKQAVKQMQELMQKERNEQAIQQRNLAAADTIHSTVAEMAPDVPVELFWAMAPRAESETPGEIYAPADRLAWQVGRAIALSRQVLRNQFEKQKAVAEKQASVTQQAQAIMPAGVQTTGASVQAGGDTPPRTMADVIKAKQAAMFFNRS